MNILVRGRLLNPPSTILALSHLFRDLDEAALPVYVECHPEHIDMYALWLKRYNLLDEIVDVIGIGEEEGIHIDDRMTFKKTIVVDRIVFGNVAKILDEIHDLI